MVRLIWGKVQRFWTRHPFIIFLVIGIVGSLIMTRVSEQADRALIERGFHGARAVYEGMPREVCSLPHGHYRLDYRLDKDTALIAALGPHADFPMLVRGIAQEVQEGEYFVR